MKLLLHSAAQLVLVTNGEHRVLKGNMMQSIDILSGLEGVSVVVDENGRIADYGLKPVVEEKWKDASFDEVIDATGMCVLPGFVDAHTHPIWSGDRIGEFIMKLEGASYLEIHKQGGGIYSTVESTNKASDEELYQKLEQRLSMMLRAGTTVAECKSGYGLTLESEVRLLKILKKAKTNHAIDVSITFCGAHAVPKGMGSAETTNKIIEEHLPALGKMISSGTVEVENIDVFCEKGIFNLEECRRILKAGQQIQLRANFHGDELHPLGCAEMGAELKATAISHLEEISAEGIKAMARAGSIAVILPTTAFLMKLKHPPVRQLINEGVPIALGSDFNPNAYCLSMPLVMHLACVHLGMSVTEALVASTLNAAASLGRAASNGSIERGKWGDFVLVKSSRWEHIIYQLGAHSDLIHAVIKQGKIVYKQSIA